MEQAQAIQFLKGLGFRVTKPKATKRNKNRTTQLGPTFVATFADGNVTRMSTFTPLETLDYRRGARNARVAYESRARQFPNGTNAVVPPIVGARFEKDGKTLAMFNERQLAA